MSQNTDYFNSTTSPFSSSSSASRHRSKRISSHQAFLPTPSEYNTPSSMVNSFQHDSPSPPSLTSPIVNDVCSNSQNGVRNASIVAKIKDNVISQTNHIQDKYSFTLNFSSSTSNQRKEQTSITKPRFYSSGMNSQQQEDLHSPFELDVPICDQNPVNKIQSDFLIDRMLKDDHNLQYSTQYRSTEPSIYLNTLNNPSPLATPLSDHRDVDALSDAGTYIIEDDGDIARDDEPEQDTEKTDENNDQESISSSSVTSPFRRYVTKKRNRHGTFDIQGLASSNPQAVARPIVDLNSPSHDAYSPLTTSSKSSSSSLLSLPTESDTSPRKEPEDASQYVNDLQTSNDGSLHRSRPTTLVEHKRPSTPPQTQIKPAECFVISPTFETKGFANNNANVPRRRNDQTWKNKQTTTSSKESSIEPASRNVPSSPPSSVRMLNNDQGRFPFRLQQQGHNEQKSQVSNLKTNSTNLDFGATLSKTSVRPHTLVQDHNVATSPFQRHTPVRQTMPAHIQHNRPSSASTTTTTTTKYVDDQDESLLGHPSLTKVYMNKSFALRRQRSNVTPSQSKPVQVQQSQQGQISSVPKTLISRQPLKPTVSMANPTLTPSSSAGSSSGQTNRAVELRRARAQAKIEELAQRTRQQLQKTEQHHDIMSASWHSNASSSGKRDPFQQRPTSRMVNSTTSSQKQDMLKTRTITSATHHRSSSASPNPAAEPATSTRYRRTMISSVTDEAQYAKMNDSTYSESGRGDSLRDDGQRLAIKLIQLSSGILAKLKPSSNIGDNDSNIRDLEQLVDKLQTVNRTLSTIDASLTTSANDEDR